MDIKKLLGDKYKEDLSKEDLIELLGGVEVVSQSDFDKKISEMGNENRLKAEEKLKKDEKFISDLKSQIKKEIEDDAKSTAEEKAQKILDKANETLSQAQILSNTAKARDLFNQAKIKEEQYGLFIGQLVTNDETKTTENVNMFIKNFQSAVASEVEEAKKEISKTVDENKPKVSGSNGNEPDETLDYSKVKSFEDLAKL